MINYLVGMDTESLEKLLYSYSSIKKSPFSIIVSDPAETWAQMLRERLC